MSKGPGNPYHDKDGKFASGPSYGKGQTLKGVYKGPSKSSNVGSPASANATKGNRWGRMNSTAKAALTSAATFKSKLVSPSKKSKGKSVGFAPAKVFSDERLMSHFKTDTSNMVERKKGNSGFSAVGKGPRVARDEPRPMAFYARHESPAAVAITTAKALDRDFHAAKKKSDQEAMKAALAKSSVPVIKYPSTKPKSKDHPKTYMKTKR